MRVSRQTNSYYSVSEGQQDRRHEVEDRTFCSEANDDRSQEILGDIILTYILRLIGSFMVPKILTGT